REGKGTQDRRVHLDLARAQRGGCRGPVLHRQGGPAAVTFRNGPNGTHHFLGSVAPHRHPPRFTLSPLIRMTKFGYPAWRTLPLIVAMCLAPLAWGQEVCDNGIDDDGNGLIDLNDTLACPCTVVPPATNLLANGSFEDHDCCPEGPHQYFQCSTGWMNY